MTSVPFDPAMVRTLATILTDTGIGEIEIAEGTSRIRLANHTLAAAPRPMAPTLAAGAASLAQPASRR